MTASAQYPLLGAGIRVEVCTGPLQNQLLSYTLFIRLMYQSGMGQASLLDGGLFGEDMALEGMLPLDFARAGQLKALLGTGFGFHFRHFGPFTGFYFFFPPASARGASIMIILFPSSLGTLSTFPNSSTS